MRHFSFFSLAILAGLATAVPLQAEPFIFYKSVFNAASYAAPGTPNGSLARGSIVSIFGRDMGPGEGVQVSAYPLEDELAGVSIEVCQEDNCVAAIPIFVRADQINAILRSDTPLGDVSIRVSYNGEAGNFTPATVVEASVGLFAVNSAGFGPGVVQNFVSATEVPLNSADVTTTRGSILVAWGTGLGAGLNADSQAPAAGDLPTGVEIWIGHAQVTNIAYRGRTPCCSGVDQFVFTVPADAPLGCFVPVSIRTNQDVVSNYVTIAITEDGAPCADDAAGEAIRNGDRVGGIVLSQIERDDRQLGVEFTQEVEVAEAYFSDEVGGPFAFSPLYGGPPVGSCLVSHARSAEPFTTLAPGLAPVADLDAGPVLSFAAGANSADIERHTLGRPGYIGSLGSRNALAGLDDLILESSSEVTVSTTGGADVGPINISLPLGERTVWTNRGDIDSLDRASGVTVTWAATDAAFVSVTGGTRDLITNSTTWFECLADAANGTFTVPPRILSSLAPPRIRESQQEAWLGLTAVPAEALEFTAEGLDSGFASVYAPVVKTVEIH